MRKNQSLLDFGHHHIPDYLLDSLINDFKKEKGVSNQYFDQIFPPEVRSHSSTHWTPVEVAQRATHLLSFKESTKILDVGSGCGKFCLVGALTRSDSQFYGAEQRPSLNSLARNIARDLDLKNTTFLDGNVFDLNWHEFDAFYFFNPFWENKLASYLRIDHSIKVSHNIFDDYVEEVSTNLEKLKKGTRIVTYHGFGGRFPPSYECIHFEPCGSDQIKLWEKK